jgi:hypothetical protein
MSLLHRSGRDVALAETPLNPLRGYGNGPQ